MPNAPSTPISSGASMGRGLASLGGYSQNTYTRASAGVLGGLLAAGEGAFQSARQADYADEMQYYQQQMQLAMSEIGTPRYPPDQIGKLVQQRPNEVSPNLINFVAGVGSIIVKPAPYFIKHDPVSQTARKNTVALPWQKYTAWWALACLISNVLSLLVGKSVGAFTFWHAGTGQMSMTSLRILAGLNTSINSFTSVFLGGLIISLICLAVLVRGIQTRAYLKAVGITLAILYVPQLIEILSTGDIILFVFEDALRWSTLSLELWYAVIT